MLSPESGGGAIMPRRAVDQSPGVRGCHAGAAQAANSAIGEPMHPKSIDRDIRASRRSYGKARVLLVPGGAMRNGTVTGPSLMSCTFMSAAKLPVSTRGWALRARATKCS